ncbi:hypothetical protein [Kineococcus aurantiacus]|uniref:Uncharacterized protein n=1 Tax=Kineococcus aurantiacus TaxID=37633 RepID=A0A7Y9DM35_9ACTN|nr:hypothetical protein [Kineococcus aurantiacus]NYD23024.1 hypothetical protein [Kineococcus aurantiacus]
MDLGQDAVRALARRTAAAADDVRATRRPLTATGEVAWMGLSAARFRDRLGDADRRVGLLADTCDDAAARLAEHAAALTAELTTELTTAAGARTA